MTQTAAVTNGGDAAQAKRAAIEDARVRLADSSPSEVLRWAADRFAPRLAFATGFGPDHLLTNDFRLAYLQDAENNPDGGFPTVSDGLPPADPEHPLRRALKTNDQRAWTPEAPMLLCAGRADPAVLYLNTQLMQDFWASETTVSVLDIDSAVEPDDPFETQKEQFEVVKDFVELLGGTSEVLQNYHAGLVAPFCLSAVRQFFDGL